MSLPLLVRSPLRPGESLPSLLVRLSQENLYPSLNMVEHLCRERLTEPDRVTLPTRVETFQVLQNLARIGADELYQASGHRFATTMMPPPHQLPSIVLPSEGKVFLLDNTLLIRHLWPEANSQFCPLCLAESVYHRLIWMPVAVTVCLQHQCLLVRGCPNCAAKLRIQDVSGGSCPRCGFELAASPPTSVASDEFGLFGQAIIQSWFGSTLPATFKDNGKLPAQPAVVLYRLLDGLRRAIMQVGMEWTYLHHSPCELPQGPFPAQNKTELNPTTAYLLYATAFQGLLSWPDGFYRFLEAYRRQTRTTGGHLIHRALGHSLYYNWAKGPWQSPAFGFVQEALGQYFLDNYAFIFPLVKLSPLQANPVVKVKLPYLTETEAAHMLGARPEMIKRLVRTGFLIKYDRKEFPTTLNLVSRTQVLALQQAWQGLIPLEAAAKMLGLSREVVMDLIKVGLLEAIPAGFGSNNDKVSYQGITRFISRLRESLKWYVAPYPTRASTGFVQATQELGPYGFETVDLIQSVLQREVRAYGMSEADGLDRLQIFNPDLGILFEGLRTNHLVLIDEQVSNMMHVDQAIILDWVKQGLLTLVEQIGRALYFDRAEVRSFMSQLNPIEGKGDGCQTGTVARFV